MPDTVVCTCRRARGGGDRAHDRSSCSCPRRGYLPPAAAGCQAGSRPSNSLSSLSKSIGWGQQGCGRGGGHWVGGGGLRRGPKPVKPSRKQRFLFSRDNAETLYPLLSIGFARACGWKSSAMADQPSSPMPRPAPCSWSCSDATSSPSSADSSSSLRCPPRPKAAPSSRRDCQRGRNWRGGRPLEFRTRNTSGGALGVVLVMGVEEIEAGH